MKSYANLHVIKKLSRWGSLLLPLILVLAACSPSAGATTAPSTAAPAATSVPTSAAVATSAPIPATGSEATVNVATDPKLGQILVDGKGMTLYAFAKDTADTSACDASCQKLWPPLHTSGNPAAGSGVDASMLGSASLPDGAKIVTYNHMPLYTFIKDTKSGDTNGQGVGSVWFAVSPKGAMIQPASSGGGSGNATPTAPASSSGGYSYGGSSSSGSTAPAASAEATVNVATDPKLGQILVDGKGMTLYIFTKDTPDKSNCSTGCLASWPPLVTQGNPVIGSGVDASMLGSTTLADGRKIVTYNHMPLYTYGKDTKPGDTNGQGVGSVWFAISPSGSAVGQ